TTFDKGFAKTAKIEGKALYSCVKQYGKLKLPPGATAETCIVADARGKVSRSKDKMARGFSKRCVGEDPPGSPRRPSVGMRVPAIASIAAMTAAASLTDRVFAGDLDTALLRESDDVAAAKCQQALTRDITKCYDARLKDYNACTKRGLKKGTIIDSSGLEACIGADTKAKVAKACGSQSKLAGDIAARCSGVDLLAAFPACGASDASSLHACLERETACVSCLAINEIGDLNRDCDSLDDGSANASCPDLTFPGTSLRFHPGHYLLLSGGSIGQEALDAIRDNPDVRGVSNVYNWVALEGDMGVYDFSAIAADLAAVKSINKRLMIMIRDKSFAGNPFIPVPLYMRTAEYAGGYVGDDQTGYIANRWVSAVNARYTALIQALGVAFSDDPFLEVVKTAESAPGHPVSELGPEFTPEGYATELGLRIDALADAFPDTVTALYLNWLKGANATALFDALTAHARERHVGIGGPDVEPNTAIAAYPYYPLYHGISPIMVEVQWPNYDTVEPPGDTDALLRFAIDDLRVNYICWQLRSGFETKVQATVASPDFAAEFPVDPTR
ncbi:MAG: hypothetical protein ACE5D3_04220, partial [Candidatus Binatia bacterium]